MPYLPSRRSKGLPNSADNTKFSFITSFNPNPALMCGASLSPLYILSRSWETFFMASKRYGCTSCPISKNGFAAVYQSCPRRLNRKSLILSSKFAHAAPSANMRFYCTPRSAIAPPSKNEINRLSKRAGKLLLICDGMF